MDHTVAITPEHPQSDAVRMQLDRMTGSRLFQAAPRLRHFLRFTVEQTMAGNADVLKEYLIGITVFQKPESFDPRLDSIVRVEARRLRAKVACYYETDGKHDQVYFRYRQGCYRPEFLLRSADGTLPIATGKKASILVVAQDSRKNQQLLRDLTLLGYSVVGVTEDRQEALLRLAGSSGLVLVEAG